jgi:acetylglutamate kinase
MIALPSPIVLKVGAEELAPGRPLAELTTAIARLVRGGRPVVVVHGGGDEVTARAEQLGIPTEKRDGLRVTSERMLGVVVEVLAGRVNLRLVNALTGAGVPAVGLSGVSASLLPVRAAGEPPGSLGWVGDPTMARVRLLHSLLDDGYTPVVAPVGADASGGIYNVNADLAAAAIASAMKGELLLLTDVEGVRDASGSPVASLAVSDLPAFRATGAARGGMLPKLDACSRAIRDGAPSAWIGHLPDLGATGPIPGTGTRFTARRSPTTASTILPSSVTGGR